ncbi:NAD(P)H-flavin oxidoreductase [Oscillospiraceae bacterium]|nr:NAD(P)H-flavin oxidoreductase [Oscillospiraceae bacterium]BDF75893.1 NAD(P)H-flavin oxidoreductase [Oscillospiraceae bacterium]
METREVLLTRRSVRKYKRDPIPQADLLEILEAGLAAPSAVNQQHWHFVVVRSEKRMRELADVMGNVFGRFKPVLEARFAKNPEAIEDTRAFLNSLGGAPVCILAFFLRDDYPDRDGAMQSVSAAIENILLSAWDKGVGSCWLSAPQRMGFGPELRERFAPDKGEFVAAITLGYPEQVPKMPPRRDGRYTIV